MISLLKEIKEELAIERENKLRNALILATAIVMFAVPLNFMVEISSNYIDTTATGELPFDDFYSFYFWLFCFCLGAVVIAFIKFYVPISRIFMDSFDWDAAFRDMEETGKEYDEYHIESGTMIFCEICDEEFESYRGWSRHEDKCRSENKEQWTEWDENLEDEE